MSEAKKQPSVLAVDDTPVNLLVLNGMLAGQGYNVRTASSGLLALEEAEREPPDLILLDVMMPEMDGFEVCSRLKANERLKDIPVIFISALTEMKSKVKAFSVGGVDYIPKPFQFEEVQARVATHLNLRRFQMELEKQNQQLGALVRDLLKLQESLSDQLTSAADYIRSLIPPPIKDARIQVDWRFVPSAQLGGDSLGYHWIDEDHFAVYLLDVSGHGISAALLSVSILNTLRSQSLPGVDLRRPDTVLASLNEAFQMENQNGLFFTMWYGVYNKNDGVLRYSSGGHPPAVLVADPGHALELDSQGIAVGCSPDGRYDINERPVALGAKLYVYSDGCYEICKPDGSMGTRQEMMDFLTRPDCDDQTQLDLFYERSIKMRGNESLDDDFTILRVTFA